MGWTNYIIIPKLKLIVEVSRQINELSDYQKKAISYLINEERLGELEEDIGNKSIKSLSVKDLTLLFSIYEKASSLSEMEPDKFFLYWLECRNINYEILSEFEISKKLEEYKKEYIILRMFEDDKL